MTTKDPENSVQNEQFDGNEETRESTEENANRDQAPGESLTTDVTPSSDAVTENIPEKSEPAAGEQSVASGNGDIHSTGETAPEGDASAEADAVKEAVPDDSIEEEGEIASEDSTVQDVVPDDSGAEKAETVSEAPAGKDDVVGDSIKEGKHNVEESKTEAVEETGPDSLSGEKKESIDEPAAADEGEADDDTASDDGESTGDEDEKVNYDEIELPPVDYSGFSRKELVETLALIVENRPPSEIVDDVARIKEFFYRKTKAEFNEKRLNYAKEGGNIEDFRPEPDELELCGIDELTPELIFETIESESDANDWLPTLMPAQLG